MEFLAQVPPWVSNEIRLEKSFWSISHTRLQEGRAGKGFQVQAGKKERQSALI